MIGVVVEQDLVTQKGLDNRDLRLEGLDERKSHENTNGPNSGNCFEEISLEFLKAHLNLTKEEHTHPWDVACIKPDQESETTRGSGRLREKPNLKANTAPKALQHSRSAEKEREKEKEPEREREKVKEKERIREKKENIKISMTREGQKRAKQSNSVPRAQLPAEQRLIQHLHEVKRRDNRKDLSQSSELLMREDFNRERAYSKKRDRDKDRIRREHYPHGGRPMADPRKEKMFEKVKSDYNNRRKSDSRTKGYSCKIKFDEKYEVKELLGEGSNGIVHRIVEKKTATNYAMKEYKQKDNWPNAKIEAMVLNELDHKNIIRFEKLYRFKNKVGVF